MIRWFFAPAPFPPAEPPPAARGPVAQLAEQQTLRFEHFSLRCSEPIAAMSHVVATFGRREEAERRRDQGADLIEAARSRRPEERFQFGEREFDRVEVGTVGGRNRSCAPIPSIAARTSGCLWTAR